MSNTFSRFTKFPYPFAAVLLSILALFAQGLIPQTVTVYPEGIDPSMFEGSNVIIIQGDGGQIPGFSSGGGDFDFSQESEYVYVDNNFGEYFHQGKYKTGDEKFLADVAYRYSENTAYFLDRCSFPVLSWYHEEGKAKGQVEASLLQYVEVAAHECYHGLNGNAVQAILSKNGGSSSVVDFENGEMVVKLPHSYFIDEGRFVYVKHSDTFPSRRITNLLPKSLLNNELIIKDRIEIYVDSKSPNMGTQLTGVYGLLEEFNAYYHGVAAKFDMRNYIEAKYEGEVSIGALSDFFNLNWGNLYSGVEFKIFILYYLVYAEKSEPEIFKGIWNNDPFFEVLVGLDREFDGLVQNVTNYRKELLKLAGDAGVKFELGDGWIRMGDVILSDIAPLPKEYRAALDGVEIKRMAARVEGRYEKM